MQTKICARGGQKGVEKSHVSFRVSEARVSRHKNFNARVRTTQPNLMIDIHLYASQWTK